MLTRIYRVRIKPELRAEFEPLFRTVALSSVSDCPGCTSARLGGPTSQTPHEYVMISVWDGIENLQAFAGTDWNVPHIPAGMEEFVDECWLHHFWDL